MPLKRWDECTASKGGTSHLLVQAGHSELGLQYFNDKQEVIILQKQPSTINKKQLFVGSKSKLDYPVRHHSNIAPLIRIFSRNCHLLFVLINVSFKNMHCYNFHYS
jgi:hypothetical protein